MKRTLNRSGAFAAVLLLNLALFVLFTMPFKLWVAASEITQMRRSEERRVGKECRL